MTQSRGSLPCGAQVLVTVPCRFSYLPRKATVISHTTDGKYVVQLEEPLFVEGIFEHMDIFAVGKDKVKMDLVLTGRESSS